MFREHFPFACAAILSAEVAAGRIDFFLLSLTLSLILLPLVYGGDANQIAEKARDGRDDDRA